MLQQHQQQQISQETKPYTFANHKDFETSSNVSNSDSLSQRIINYNQVLEERNKLSKVRMEELRYQLYEEQMRECTFRPHITHNVAYLNQHQQNQNQYQRDENDGDDDDVTNNSLSLLPAYERLYQQKDKLPKSIQENKHRLTGEKELDECTFRPNIHHTRNNNNKNNNSMQKSNHHNHKNNNNESNDENNFNEFVTNTKIPFQKNYDSESETDETHSHSEFSSLNTSINFEKIIENSTKNSIIEIMKERYESNEATIPLPPPPPPQPKGYSESIQRYSFLNYTIILI